MPKEALSSSFASDRLGESISSYPVDHTKAQAELHLDMSYGSPRLPLHNHNKSERRLNFGRARWIHILFRPIYWPNKVKGILLLALVFLLCFNQLYELKVEVFLYSKGWINREIQAVEPLSGCFEQHRIPAEYNYTNAFGPKKTEIQAGLPLQIGLDCYDLAGSLQPEPRPSSSPRIYYHTYWRSDLASFGERQEWLLKSFFATQEMNYSTLILWSNGKLSPNKFIDKWLARYPRSFELRIVDIPQLAMGTPLEGNKYLDRNDPLAWVDGDLVRLLVVWNFGGAWVDMDSLLTRDIYPLLEHEFFIQWDCYDKKYTPFNGALFHFYKKSPYLCEALHIMATGPPPRLSSTDWGSMLYFKLWRRLVAANIPPFKVLPFCFTDGRSCRLDNRLPDPFVPDPSNGRWPLRGPQYADAKGLAPFAVGGLLDRTLGKVFSVHLHNQWQKSFPKNGWVRRLLLERYNRILGV